METISLHNVHQKKIIHNCNLTTTFGLLRSISLYNGTLTFEQYCTLVLRQMKLLHKYVSKKEIRQYWDHAIAEIRALDLLDMSKSSTNMIYIGYIF